MENEEQTTPTQAPEQKPAKEGKKGLCPKCPIGKGYPWCVICILIIVAVVYAISRFF